VAIDVEERNPRASFLRVDLDLSRGGPSLWGDSVVGPGEGSLGCRPTLLTPGNSTENDKASSVVASPYRST
jgi:hypothetical protein